MQTVQNQWTEEKGWVKMTSNDIGDKAQLVFIFGAREVINGKNKNKIFEDIKSQFPAAHFIGCSTSGEILGAQVFDDTVSVTAVQFEKTDIQVAKISLNKMEDSFQAGVDLCKQFKKEGLVHIFVLSEGIHVNGSGLTKGLIKNLPSHVLVTGGLAGDKDQFKETVIISDGPPESNTVTAIGFYGDAIRIGCGSMGGWDSFGPDRKVTKSKGNVLYELDGEPALDLYKKYLGEQADGLPATALLFPISLRLAGSEKGLVRTILAVNDEEKSMTFAGDIPEGSNARLMKANFERLVEGASGAAHQTTQLSGSHAPTLAILISCVGRKLVLKQRVEDEVESVREILGDKTTITGFYSYGELCPFVPLENQCELHNQTMTITTFAED